MTAPATATIATASVLAHSPKAASAAGAAPLVSHDLTKLAPKFRDALLTGLHECWVQGFDAVVYEATRSDALQRYYYEQGRSRPGEKITWAPSALYSWHFYGLAVDVISREYAWKVRADWRAGVTAILKAGGLAWGGDWPKVDQPHYQWKALRATPSDRARELYAAGGVQRVWQEVGAAA